MAAKDKDFELSQIVNAKKIVDSMAFKTGLSAIQILVVIIISVFFAQVMLGFNSLSYMGTGDFWANVAILFAEQYYMYYIIYDWFFTALSKSDERLVGNDEEDGSDGLLVETQILLEAFDTNSQKLEQGLDGWNERQKIKTYQDNVKHHITKLQNKLEKYKLKGNKIKIEEYQQRLQNAKDLFEDEEILKNITFVNVKNYTPMEYKDLISDGNYIGKQKGSNSLINLRKIKFRRFFLKGSLKVFLSLSSGLLAFGFIIGGEGFWQRFGIMMFLMSLQVIFAIKDAYVDNNISIINQSLKKKALLFCTEFKPKEKDIVKTVETVEDKPTIDIKKEALVN